MLAKLGKPLPPFLNLIPKAYAPLISKKN